MKNLLFLASILSASLVSAETTSNANKNTQLYALGGIRRASIKHHSETVNATASSYHSTFGIFIEKTRENGKFVNGLVLGVMTGYSAKIPHAGEHTQKYLKTVADNEHKRSKALFSQRKQGLDAYSEETRKIKELELNAEEEKANAAKELHDIENRIEKGIQYFGGVSFGYKASPAITLYLTPGILACKAGHVFSLTQAIFATIAKAELKVTENLSAFIAYQFEAPTRHTNPEGKKQHTQEHCTHGLLIGFGSKF